MSENNDKLAERWAASRLTLVKTHIGANKTMVLSTWSWSGVVIENDANTTREKLNRRSEMLAFQQTTSIQR